jgi:hypothetical protein
MISSRIGNIRRTRIPIYTSPDNDPVVIMPYLVVLGLLIASNADVG